MAELERAQAILTAAIANTKASARSVRKVPMAHGFADKPALVRQRIFDSHHLIYGDAREPD